MTRVTFAEAATRLTELARSAASGEEVLLVEGDLAVKLVPAPSGVSPARRRAGSAAGALEIADDFDSPLPEFDTYTT